MSVVVEEGCRLHILLDDDDDDRREDRECELAYLSKREEDLDRLLDRNLRNCSRDSDRDRGTEYPLEVDDDIKRAFEEEPDSDADHGSTFVWTIIGFIRTFLSKTSRMTLFVSSTMTSIRTTSMRSLGI